MLRQRTAQGLPQLLDRDGGADPAVGEAVEEFEREVGGALQEIGIAHVFQSPSWGGLAGWARGPERRSARRSQTTCEIPAMTRSASFWS